MNFWRQRDQPGSFVVGFLWVGISLGSFEFGILGWFGFLVVFLLLLDVCGFVWFLFCFFF